MADPVWRAVRGPSEGRQRAVRGSPESKMLKMGHFWDLRRSVLDPILTAFLRIYKEVWQKRPKKCPKSAVQSALGPPSLLSKNRAGGPSVEFWLFGSFLKKRLEIRHLRCRIDFFSRLMKGMIVYETSPRSRLFSFSSLLLCKYFSFSFTCTSYWIILVILVSFLHAIGQVAYIICIKLYFYIFLKHLFVQNIKNNKIIKISLFFFVYTWKDIQTTSETI